MLDSSNRTIGVSLDSNSNFSHPIDNLIVRPTRESLLTFIEGIARQLFIKYDAHTPPEQIKDGNTAKVFPTNPSPTYNKLPNKIKSLAALAEKIEAFEGDEFDLEEGELLMLGEMSDEVNKRGLDVETYDTDDEASVRAGTVKPRERQIAPWLAPVANFSAPHVLNREPVTQELEEIESQLLEPASEGVLNLMTDEEKSTLRDFFNFKNDGLAWEKGQEQLLIDEKKLELAPLGFWKASRIAEDFAKLAIEQRKEKAQKALKLSLTLSRFLPLAQKEAQKIAYQGEMDSGAEKDLADAITIYLAYRSLGKKVDEKQLTEGQRGALEKATYILRNLEKKSYRSAKHERAFVERLNRRRDIQNGLHSLSGKINAQIQVVFEQEGGLALQKDQQKSELLRKEQVAALMSAKAQQKLAAATTRREEIDSEVNESLAWAAVEDEPEDFNPNDSDRIAIIDALY